MNSIEIELRFELTNPSQLPSFLALFEKIRQSRDIDIYLDTSEAILYQHGIFIRVRNNGTLDFKFNRQCLDNPNLAIQDYCEEHTFELPLQAKDLGKINELLKSLDLHSIQTADLELLKANNHFGIHYCIDKRREVYKSEGFTICVDTVADLGTFLEIELMAKDIENLAVVKQQMLNLIKGLDVIPLSTGYGTLLLRKKDFAHYLLGRFVLEEDKQYRKNAA